MCFAAECVLVGTYTFTFLFAKTFCSSTKEEPKPSPQTRFSRGGRSTRELPSESDVERTTDGTRAAEEDPKGQRFVDQEIKSEVSDNADKSLDKLREGSADTEQQVQTKRNEVERQLESALSSARAQRDDLIAGQRPSADSSSAPANRNDVTATSSTSTKDSAISSAGNEQNAGVAQPKLTKGQEAALRKKQAALAEQQREADLAALAKQEALRHAHEEKIIRQAKMVQKRREGDAIVKKMSRYAEPPRKKTHWDYLLQEMEWLANDYGEERRWKMALAKKVSAAVLKYHKMKSNQRARELKIQQQNLKKIAARMSKDVKMFWGQVNKLVVYKHEVQVEEIRQQNIEKHMNFMVGQTERYSRMLAEDLEVPSSGDDAKMVDTADADDADFVPSGDLLDDETTLEEVEDGPLRVAEDEATSTLASESVAPIAELLANYGLDEQVFENGIPEPQSDAEDGMEIDESPSAMESNGGNVDIAVDQDAEENAELSDSHDEEEDEDVDLAILVDPDSKELTDEEKALLQKKQDRMNRASASAEELTPNGWTLETAGQGKKCDVPFIIKANLREYQHVALNWLTSLYDKKLNGILADEMGLGKTLMTISMLAYLALERRIWGPHLIVVPTSVMLNWEIEFKKFCPAFKILTYYGTQKERKEKRKGWTQQNFFHVCITSYKLVVQDQHVFRRKAWSYLILDEAHHIKNFQSQRWQTMLNFNTKRRLLLTGTPLQNDLMELWSLMHFLMPHIFASHKEFKDWFSNPLLGMAADKDQMNQKLVSRLHGVLRPFILRRLKSQVEKQLPSKTEHVVPCPLSPRQRVLYEEYMGRSDTKKSLASGNYIGIMNVVMQLRKVCNHPDLFEVRPIVSPFDVPAPVLRTSSLVAEILDYDPFAMSSIVAPSFSCLIALEHSSRYASQRIKSLQASYGYMLKEAAVYEVSKAPPPALPYLAKQRADRRARYRDARRETLKFLSAINDLRCKEVPVYGCDLVNAITLDPFSVRIEAATEPGVLRAPRRVERWWQCDKIVHAQKNRRWESAFFVCLRSLCRSLEDCAVESYPMITRCVMTIRKSRSKPVSLECGSKSIRHSMELAGLADQLRTENSRGIDLVRPFEIRKQLYFPDKRLIQFDCGKLQVLDRLLRELRSGGHRCLIFTQMTKMLDVLEHFLNLYGYTYLRLDGATKVEERQKMMDRFNSTNKYFIFILSTRSGGVGINLTGADTVIFYDSDWNPAMDAQAQDRCHRIGQTREVHIYRLISEHTVEENILQKSRQKSEMNRMVLAEGNFTVDAFKKWGSAEVKSLFGDVAADEKLEHDCDADDSPIDREAPTQDVSSPSASAEQKSGSEQDNENESIASVREAMASVEDEDDIIAARRAERESSATIDEFVDEKVNTDDPVTLESKARHEFLQALKRGRQGSSESQTKKMSEEFDWENDLLPIQKFAMDFLVRVYPMVNTKQSVEKMDFEEQEWELDKLQQLKMEEEEKLEEDGDLLFYDVAEGGGNREIELLELREKFFAAQHVAFVEMTKQRPQVKHALEIGPPNPPDLAPDYDDERPDRPVPPPPKISQSSEREITAPDDSSRPEYPAPKPKKHSRKQIAEQKTKMNQIAARQKVASTHEVSGEGDGLFNIHGKPNRDRKKAARVDRRKPGAPGETEHDETSGSPWSEKQVCLFLF
eukprot:SAG31_NODE_1650_length_7635_cov_12.658705_1_plen_1667_part_00